jgi:mannosyl-oligosaccharide glucosidase
LLLTNIISKITDKSPYSGQPSKYITSPQNGRSLLKELFPLVTRNYNWFRRTQAGNFTAYSRPDGANTEGYRWKGRTPGLTLTSGLDDYPRAEPPHPGELHLDALGWVGAMANALQQITEYLGEDDNTLYGGQLRDVRHNLEALHWNAAQSAYCDATVGADGKYQTVCHLGYMSLMPLLLGHLNESHPNLPAVLDLLSDSKKLWSPYGLRSLSLTDENYGKGDNYWRGAVWMNLNVLAVLRLRDIGNGTSQGVRARSLAAALRTRVVNTVYNSWEQTGFVWEQYNDKTGQGQRSRAFTGWTACVILLMGLNDDAAGGADTEIVGGASSWSIPTISFIIVLILGLGVFRQKVIGLFIWTAVRCRYWFHNLRSRARERGEYEVIDLDEDLFESDEELDDWSRPTVTD